MDTLIAAIISEAPPLKRPPHIVFAAGVPFELSLEPDMRRSLPAIILAAALWNILPAASMAADIPRPPSDAFVMAEVPAIAPDTPFALPDGTSAKLSDWRGKIVVLNFWATWCAPCVKELPSLDRLSAALPSETHAVLITSTDRGGPKKVPPFLKKLKTENLAPYLDAKSALGRAFGMRGLPTTYIISKDGNVLAKLEGAAEWDSPEIVEWLKTLTDWQKAT
jgi:thiol-disulfide isomerase/thioredoxin